MDLEKTLELTSSDTNYEIKTYPKELIIFLEPPTECPQYVNKYYLEILSLLGSIETFSTNNYSLNYYFQKIKDIYRKLIITYCEDLNYYVGNLDTFINEIISSDIVLTQSIGNFFKYIQKRINEEFNNTQNKLKRCIERDIEYYAQKDLPSRYYSLEDYQEVLEIMNKIKEHLLSLYSRYIIINEPNQLFKDIKDVIESYCDIVREDHYQRKYNGVNNLTIEMNKEYRKIPGSSEFKWDIDNIFREAINRFNRKEISIEEARSIIEARINILLKGFRERFKRLEELVQLYSYVTKEEISSLTKFLYPDYYANQFEIKYQELREKLECEKSNRNIPEIADCTPQLVTDTDLDYKEGEYFLVYCGETLEDDEIHERIKDFIPEDYVINEEGIKDKLFLKIVKRQNREYMDPSFKDREDKEKTILTVSGYNLMELKSFCYQFFQDDDINLWNKVVPTIYKQNGIDIFNIIESSMSLCSVIYDSRYDEFIMGVCGIPNDYTHLYVGYINDDTGYMCSNNRSMLALFCERVYEVQSGTCIVNGEVKNLRLDTRLLLKRY